MAGFRPCQCSGCFCLGIGLKETQEVEALASASKITCGSWWALFADLVGGHLSHTRSMRNTASGSVIAKPNRLCYDD